MTPVQQFEGIVAPLLRANVDTDAIIPSREMKRVSKHGLAGGLFAGWRYLAAESRVSDPGFVLNDERYRGASILATGPNFGCGSSREHAVWALREYGFRAILAPSFSAIFERNCFNNGLLPIVVNSGDIAHLLAYTEAAPRKRQLTVDLETLTLSWNRGQTLAFSIPEMQREMLLNGWDPVDRTLQLGEQIDHFLAQDQKQRPWVYETRHEGG